MTTAEFNQRNDPLFSLAPARSALHSLAERPAPPSSDIQAPFMPGARRPPLVIERGQGSYVWDAGGRRYLDFLHAGAVNALGHCAPEVQAALAEQSSLLISASAASHNRPALELARFLIELTGAAQVSLCSGGAEANEAAIALARSWGKRHRRGAYGIVTSQNARYGRTLAAMTSGAARSTPGSDEPRPTCASGFRRVPFGDASAMERAIDASTVALMLEPIQGEAGLVLPPEGYLARLRELCDQHDLLLILDEVQTGVGRTGRFLAQEHESVRADITTLGEGLGAGLPVSAVLASERAACFEPGDAERVQGGNPLMAHVALAVCRVIGDPRFLERVERRGLELYATLASLAQRWGRSAVRARGLLATVEFEDPISERLSECARAEGVLVNPARPTRLRFMPQLRVSSAEICELGVRLARAHARL